ncbi:MAG: hypothetical protein GW808_03355 [Sphingomonadales bacterium]|nr:hypothetical protein [Sphingomonadales bacterium]PIX64923.1 MAG: hypothetical protein COZ43_10505 [Sphingomonadales bacterium CG_4_10_14_3_um_filter_58_15]NCO48534.1 hypothetical protein [Sphingomonadales bacterium]NCP00541.1 hypothetical protein [Sphingomonadales bacterium]NCP25765.1 hypothetical protein [Sphingomonadales bacterium]
MTTQTFSGKAEHIWAATVATASVLGSWIFACITPFAAIGVLLAATLSPRKAMAWMGGVWLTNQLVGYLILDYPRTVNSFAHGGSLLFASMAGLFVAIGVLKRRNNETLVSLGLAFAAAFVAYESLLYVAALYLGGIDTFAPDIVWLIAKNDFFWFAGLLAARVALTRALPQFYAPQLAVRST